MDDTGLSGRDPVFVFAGQIAPAVMWGEFSDRWRAVLDEPPRIRYFKMYEAAKYKKQFYGWSKEKRDDKLYRLARVISRCGFTAIHTTITLADFRASAATQYRRPLSDPYFYAFHLAIHGVAHDLLDRGQKYRFEMFFDENSHFGPKAKAWYPIMREWAEPEVRAIMPVEPLFRTDDEFLPLQAADMLAWCFRMAYTSEREAEFKEFKWLLPTIFTVPVSDYSITFKGENFRPKFTADYPQTVIDAIDRDYDRFSGMASPPDDEPPPSEPER
jgi:hypothetical protein